MLPFSPAGSGAPPPRITVRVPAGRPAAAQAPARPLQGSAAPAHAHARPAQVARAASHVARSSAGAPVGRDTLAAQHARLTDERVAARAPNGGGNARGRSGAGSDVGGGERACKGKGAASWAVSDQGAASALGCRPAAGASAGVSRGPGSGPGSWVSTDDATQERSAGSAHRTTGNAAPERGAGDAWRRSAGAVEPQRCYAAAPWPASADAWPSGGAKRTLSPGEHALLAAQQQQLLLRAAAHWKAGREAAGRAAASPARSPAAPGAGLGASGLRAELQQYADPAVQRQLAAQAQRRERQAAEQVREHAWNKGVWAVTLLIGRAGAAVRAAGRRPGACLFCVLPADWRARPSIRSSCTGERTGLPSTRKSGCTLGL